MMKKLIAGALIGVAITFILIFCLKKTMPAQVLIETKTDNKEDVVKNTADGGIDVTFSFSRVAFNDGSNNK